MKRTAQEKFVEFVEKHPECYSITKSGIFIKFLKIITRKPRSYSELVTGTSNIEKTDLDLILLALESAGLLKRIRSMQKEVFQPTPKAKMLLQKYEAAKKGLGPS